MRWFHEHFSALRFGTAKNRQKNPQQKGVTQLGHFCFFDIDPSSAELDPIIYFFVYCYEYDDTHILLYAMFLEEKMHLPVSGRHGHGQNTGHGTSRDGLLQPCLSYYEYQDSSWHGRKTSAIDPNKSYHSEPAYLSHSFIFASLSNFVMLRTHRSFSHSLVTSAYA